MKFLNLFFTILEYLIPVLAKLGKDKLAQELDVTKQVVKILTKDMLPGNKGRAIEEAVGNLKAVKDFKKSVCKKLDKAKARLYKKLF